MSATASNGTAENSSVRARSTFPRSIRLLRHAEFERVYKEGRRHFSTHMTVFYLRRAEGSFRIGFTVSRALGGAVQRNRMKRRLREAVRLQSKGTKTAVDVVINPKKTLLTADFDGIVQEVKRAFEVIERKADEQASR